MKIGETEPRFVVNARQTSISTFEHTSAADRRDRKGDLRVPVGAHRKRMALRDTDETIQSPRPFPDVCVSRIQLHFYIENIAIGTKRRSRLGYRVGRDRRACFRRLGPGTTTRSLLVRPLQRLEISGPVHATRRIRGNVPTLVSYGIRHRSSFAKRSLNNWISKS